MESQYGIAITNKYNFLIDDEDDPLDLIEQQEAKKKREEQAKKEEKGKGKGKTNKKSASQTENKNKEELIIPKKEEKVNTSKQSERPRTGRQNREQRGNRDREENDNRPPRRREENFNQENRNRDREGGDRSDGFGFGRPERTEGGGFGRGEGGFGRGDRGRGPRRGGRGGRGRGGFDRKREFDRHSGSERTGVKATEKREGGGAHNWGTVKDDIEEQLKDTTTPETNPDWNQPAEDVENQDPNESTESAANEEEAQPQQLTLDEWKKMQEKNRVKSEFKTRQAGEGVDSSQWKTGHVYRKSEGEDSEEEEEESDEDEEEDTKSKRLVDQIRITFNDSPRRGRGGRRPRGGRGPRGSGRGGADRRNPSSAPKFDDENDFPSLGGKTEA